jgi:hypothetical protein
VGHMVRFEDVLVYELILLLAVVRSGMHIDVLRWQQQRKRSIGEGG